jgi:hypothetical protein
MGSKISRVVRAHVKADAAVAPTTCDPESHDINNTNGGLRQDPAPQLLEPVCNLSRGTAPFHSLARDDIDISVSTFTASTMNSQRRHSASNTEGRQQLLNSFEQFLAERQIMAIDYEDTSLQLPAQSVPAPAPVEPVPQCIICCAYTPENGAKEFIKPCRSCQSDYCTLCVRNMFLDACKDSSRMPPRCCVPVNIHHAKPYLSAEEATLFRSRYEEWCTPNPIYCPVPVCSAFIPDRLVPQHVRTKQRADSGIGTPSSTSFACPTCDADICTDCRQQAHPGSMCSIHEFGLDAETAKLLKMWGYKKCPKCGHGVKRMYGCHHMECRCGAHFCWLCLEHISACDGNCRVDEDEDEDYSDTSPIEEFSNQATAAGNQEEATEVTGVAVSPLGPLNLDGGGHDYWQNADLDFGDEPQQGDEEAMWDCDHSFDTYTIPLATALASQSTDMECVKCWSTIHPAIDAPKAQGSAKEKIVPASASRATTFGVRGTRGRAIGRGRYAPPRGLFRANATIGTAPHLTTTILSQSLPAREVSPMEDVQFSERITDTYGNVITTIPMQPLRRASLESPDTALQHRVRKPTKTSDMFATTPTAFSLAHECEYCYMLLCEKCKVGTLEVKEAERKRKAEKEAREEEIREREQEQRLEELAALPNTTSQEHTQQETIAQQPTVQEEDNGEDLCSIGFD